MSTTTELLNFDSLWNYGKPAETRAKFLELLPLAESSGDTSYHTQLLTQIARTHSLLGDFNEAHALLDQVESMLNAELKVARVRYLLERGRCHNSSMQKDRALPLFEEAYLLGAEINEWRFAIDAVHMVAIAKSDVLDKISWNLKGIELVKEHPGQKGWLWALYNNLGEDYLMAGEYNAAADIFEKLMSVQIERSGETDIYTMKDAARAKWLGGDANYSIQIMTPVLNKILEDANDDGWIREALAETLLATGETTQAKSHFLRAYEILSTDDYCIKYEPKKLERLKEMAA